MVPKFSEIGAMKQLYVVRHGQAEPQHESGDFQRRLTAQGELDVEALARASRSNRVVGSPLWTSPSQRTTQTAQTLLKEWHEAPMNMQTQDEAYLASDRSWTQWIRHWDNAHDSGWLVGHNPGLSDLVQYLTGHSISLSTGSMAALQLEVNQWEELFAGVAHLERLFTHSIPHLS